MIDIRGIDLMPKRKAAPATAYIAAPESHQRKAEATSLRFAVGDEVECRLGLDGWLRGVVVALNTSEEQTMPVCLLVRTFARLPCRICVAFRAPTDFCVDAMVG